MSSNKQPITITLPSSVANQLGVNNDTPMRVAVKNDRLILRPATGDRGERLGLRWPLIVTVILTVGVYLYWISQKMGTVALSGDVSLASMVIGCALVAGMMLFTGNLITARNRHEVPHIYWRNLPVIIASFTIMLALALVGGFWVLGQLFPGATFDLVTAAIIFFIMTLITNYLMSQAARNVDAGTLSTLLTVVIITGVVIAMASNNHRRWWQHNLSFLGTNLANNAWQFNFTLIIAALLMIALVDTLFVAISARYPGNRRINIMRGMLSLVALDVACIGLFPNNAAFHVLHDQAAGMLIILLAALIIGIRWLLPGVSKDFLFLSYMVATALVILNFGFRLFGYPSLTSFEIQAFTVAFGWLLLLFGRLRVLATQDQWTWDVLVKVAE
ncbi:AbrB/MazE/SpoVT family DNA-binding domain-containing protein [Lacticaseibacillus pantheris]|jgi:hypothetical membrane protein|uniref:ABC transporter permease n=1 Tax=Lacticaseibacillus pantheris DSM 15945 = JCM 12539 = NBRC 106106 TaxID=1423783 RepID=A0A0R1U025_9LACO|nr:AbrB/MazE/SpoVT family DNA-binding domain-containing protein [Lacticaseibacillus pantheris]KRL84515.1 ABC transporter permease [Lacticaseibacillus pantheris DSM 15945 = JCM 12539 = NBRC 106106]WKF84834.1 AbrB/MazE/SpoVT family DNA-binding domain-containing protein [Lacticaseibacillus pantheris]